MSTSLRDMARKLNCNYKTIVRKKSYLHLKCVERQKRRLKSRPPILDIQFDDMETIEHTKLKPLSITLVVESGTRQILGAKVSKISAKGHLAVKSRKKYGPRFSNRSKKRNALFSEIANLNEVIGTVSSDQDPHYPKSVARHFPKNRYLTYKGRKPTSYGQGELKTGPWDKLFWINHTAAMVRDKMKRMSRKSWCATKCAKKLQEHLDIFIDYHNCRIIRKLGEPTAKGGSIRVFCRRKSQT